MGCASMEIETDRLIIRSFTMVDAEDYAAIVGDPEVMRYLGGRAHDRAEAEAYVVDCIDRDSASGASRYAVVLKDGERFAGFCGFKIIEVEDQPSWTDFGWRYGREFWRQGYGVEAARAVYDFGRSTLGLGVIEARAHVDNAGSLRIIEKLGFRWIEDVETDHGRFRRFLG